MSFCETYQIYVYEGYFIIYRSEESGQLVYYRSLQETVRLNLFRYTKDYFGRNYSSFLQKLQYSSYKLQAQI